MIYNLVFIFCGVSFLIASIFSIFRIRRLRREVNELEIENLVLELDLEIEKKIHDWKKETVNAQKEPASEEAKAFIKWAANLSTGVHKKSENKDKK